MPGVNKIILCDIYYMETKTTITKKINIGPVLYIAIMIFVYALSV